MGGEGGEAGFEFGINPNDDPELWAALGSPLFGQKAFGRREGFEICARTDTKECPGSL